MRDGNLLLPGGDRGGLIACRPRTAPDLAEKQGLVADVATGCRHGDPPANLEAFVKQVDVVAHVCVTEQRGEDRVPPQADRSVSITRNTVKILGVFKSNRRWPTTGRAEVRQQGGELDRGDYIEVVRRLALILYLSAGSTCFFLSNLIGLADAPRVQMRLKLSGISIVVSQAAGTSRGLHEEAVVNDPSPARKK